MNDYLLKDRYSDPETGRVSSYFCRLQLHVGATFFQYALLSVENNKFLTLADYRLRNPAGNGIDHFHLLEEVIMSMELLQKNYPSVIIGIESPVATLVPGALFSEDRMQAYLDFNYPSHPDLVPAADPIEETDAVLVYGIPNGFREFAMVHFSKVAIVHSLTALIRAAFIRQQADPGTDRLYLNISDRRISLIRFEGLALKVVNTFSWQTAEDVLFYTLTLAGQAGRPDMLEIVVSGSEPDQPDITRLLQQYLGKVSLMDRWEGLHYSPLLQQLPSHGYHPLYSLALCGS